jgi:hypothetical protein
MADILHSHPLPPIIIAKDEYFPISMKKKTGIKAFSKSQWKDKIPRKFQLRLEREGIDTRFPHKKADRISTYNQS